MVPGMAGEREAEGVVDGERESAAERNPAHRPIKSGGKTFTLVHSRQNAIIKFDLFTETIYSHSCLRQGEIRSFHLCV